MTAPAGSEDAGLVLSAEEREVVEVACALFGWATQREAIEAVRRAVESIIAARIARTPPPAGDAQRSQEASNGPVGAGDAGDGRDDESGRGAGL